MDLHNMFSLIRDYHCKLGYDCSIMHPEDLAQHMRNMSFAAFMEVAELADSTPWKPWRRIEDQTCDIENATTEVIDVIFFLVGVLECLGVEPDQFEQAFLKKLKENMNRIKRGYNNKLEER